MPKNKETIYDIVLDALSVLSLPYILYLAYLYFTNKIIFYKAFLFGLFIIIGIFLIPFYFKKRKKEKIESLIKKINGLNLKDEINDFINRYGKEKGKYVWKYMDYGFDYNKMKIFIKTLEEKGLHIKELSIFREILKHFINIKEEALIRNGFEDKRHQLALLTGEEFEILLIKLFEAMGYMVKHIGGKGDQGGDLILNKDNQRILVQAKCYNNNSIGNNAIQQAVAAKKYYDCNRVIVIGTSNYTREAIQLAKSNEVQLIWKKELQELLIKNLKESWI